MTVEEAKEIVEYQGFAWEVLGVLHGSAFDIILCEWKGMEHTMYYSNACNKVVKII